MKFEELKGLEELKGKINMEQKKFKALITVTTSREDFKKNYTLHARMGIRFAQIIGLIKLEFLD